MEEHKIAIAKRYLNTHDVLGFTRNDGFRQLQATDDDAEQFLEEPTPGFVLFMNREVCLEAIKEVKIGPRFTEKEVEAARYAERARVRRQHMRAVR